MKTSSKYKIINMKLTDTEKLAKVFTDKTGVKFTPHTRYSSTTEILLKMHINDDIFENKNILISIESTGEVLIVYGHCNETIPNLADPKFFTIFKERVHNCIKILNCARDKCKFSLYTESNLWNTS